MTETKKERITTYSDSLGGICHMRTMPHGVDFGFLKGARMKDQHALLTGKGKKMRVLSMNIFDPKILDYYLQQAIVLNTK